MAVSQVITALPVAGHRGVDAQTLFVTKQEQFQDALQGVAVGQLNTAFGQINTTETNVNTKEASAVASATSATNSATSATSSATSATNSATSATNSATSATNSATSATNSATSATNSTTSATNSATSALSDRYITQAERMTADSYATEVTDVFVKIYTSVGNGTFTSVNTTEYSASHWASKASATSGVVATLSSAAPKVTPVDADTFNLIDSADASTLKKVTWANIKTTLSGLFAALASPVFTGTPTAPTAVVGTSTTQLATTAFVGTAPVFTGTPTAPTAATTVSTTQLATTAFAVPRTSPTGVAVLPTGTTAERPLSPLAGWTRFNTTLVAQENYNGTAWALTAPPVVIDQTASNIYLHITQGGF